MKKQQYKQLTIAAALAAVFSVPFAANAMTATVTATQLVPSNVFKSATAGTIQNTSAITVVAGDSDVFLGRTTGFNVVITLTGAKFKNITTPTTSAGLNVTGWTISKAGGGTGSNVVTYSFTPGATAAAIVAGNLFSFAAGDMTFNNATTLNTAGNSISASIAFNDPVGGSTLATATLAPTAGGGFITSEQGVQFASLTGTSTVKRIDVGSDATHASKSYFSTDATIKKLDSSSFAAGSFSLTAAATASCYGITSGATIASAQCTDATAAGVFAFNTATNTVSVTLTGTDLSGFRVTGATVGLVSGAESACTGTPTYITSASIAAGATGTITSMTTPAALIQTAAGQTYTVCLNVPASLTNNVKAQSLGLTVAVDLGDATNLSNPAASTGTLYSLAYNGSVREVYFFNPATNSTQLSMLRVNNPSSTNGTVTITGVNDAGTAATGTVTMTLNAGEAKTFTSSQLEAGDVAAGLTGALGTGSGKWHLTVTGEFANMQAMSVTRDSGGSLSNMSNTVNPATTIQNAN